MPLPTPDGPEITIGRGSRTAARLGLLLAPLHCALVEQRRAEKRTHREPLRGKSTSERL